jgi:hypothetical protein
MKQDRFLLGILIGIVVLVVLALVVFFTRQDNLNYVDEDTPAGVVQNYVVALHKKDYERAYGYLADLPYKPTAYEFRQAFLNHMVDPTNAGIEIGKTEISEDSASIDLGIVFSASDPFSSGYRNVDYAMLIRQEGAWKIKQLPYNFWSYEWYQIIQKPMTPVN